MRKSIKVIIVVTLAILAFMLGYLLTGHYEASDTALSYTITQEQSDYITYDNNSQTGFIFYPGAKVDSKAYGYLSELDANVYVAKFPFEMAMMDSDIAETIMSDNPEVENWYIGGHSLGGVFANRYAIENMDKIDGVVFLGSYPVSSAESILPSIALFGDQDLIVGDYTEKLGQFTDVAEIIVLDNANHSGFGDYGQQQGDAELTDEQLDQQRETILSEINEFINKN
ncbi:alpha/beta hydrolase [Mollicutes bacterium LVI A0039]|nr:alpha/beta hydrolase [Mollicutes bacterium LVI A0039]